MEKINSENKTELPQWKRIPITVLVNGKKENIWVNYIVKMKPTAGNCIKCKTEDQMQCESVSEVVVESNDSEIIKQATDKIIDLIRRHEQKMFVCKDCLTDDFMKKERLPLYVKSLEEAQNELGIEVDREEQKKTISEN